MTDLSGVSDADLMKVVGSQSPAAKPPQQMSDAELLAAINGPGYAEDIAKSAGTGLVKGVSGLIGLSDTVGNLIGAGMEYVEKRLRGESEDQWQARLAVRRAMVKQQPNLIPSAAGVEKAITENVTGELHKPQTVPGEYAQTIGEFLPGALAGPGGVVRNAVTMGVVPAIASETAGQITKGTAAEPWARAAAGLVTGGAAAMFNRPSNVGATIARATEGVTPAQLDQAEALFQQAQQAGLPLTRAEAVQAVTAGATDLSNLQRVVEGSGRMREFFAQRPGQIESARGAMFDPMAPSPANPATVGPAVGEAAEAATTGVRQAINTATEPLYDAARAQRIPPAAFNRLTNDPVFVEGLNRVRNDPWIGPTLQRYTDDSVAVADAVKKHLDEAVSNLRDPMAGTARSNYSAAIVEGANRRLVTAIDAATGSTVAGPGTYETARAIQEQARQQYLQPLLDGPLGRLRDKTTQAATEAIFPRNPVPNSADEVGTAMRALANQNEWAARQLIRAHAESTFNEATRRLTGGPNEFGGAKFVSLLRGNPQQAENLEAAVRALPRGDELWNGFHRYLDILEAQGYRQRIGSQTAFNQEALDDLRRGGVVSDTATLLAGAGMKIPTKIKDAVERLRLGRNVNVLAELLTDPAMGQRFRSLATAPAGGERFNRNMISLSLGVDRALSREPTKE